MTSEDFVLEAVRALEAAGVAYMVVGSLSSNVYGIPRSTKDADFVVELGDVPITAVMTRLGDGYSLDPHCPSKRSRRRSGTGSSTSPRRSWSSYSW